jgi:triosephosphate isomerase (TIM)
VVIAPPTLYLIPVLELVRKEIKVSAQNCYIKPNGAFTGETRYADFLGSYGAARATIG